MAAPKPLPNYDVVPLRSDETTVSVVQSLDRSVDPANADREKRENTTHLIELVDAVQGWGVKRDLLAFHEFPIHGWSHHWTKDDVLNKIAIDVPGEETEAIGEKAKQYQCYIHFGSYARDPDWPGRFMSMGIIVGPSGAVISKQWKSRNIYGMFGAQALMTTTIYDVLDEYIEKYGVDALWPVARTDIGNIATSSCLFEPEIVRYFALAGAELFIRRGTGIGGAAARIDMQAQCVANRIYGLLVNQSVTPSKIYLEDEGAGGSCVVDPTGAIIGEVRSPHETAVTATIPIAAFRKRHSIPVLTKELYEPPFARYQSKYPPNMHSPKAPDNLADAGAWLQREIRW